MKEIVYQTEGWPRKRVVCYSCSIGGKELHAESSGDETGTYTAAQLHLLGEIAKTHDRSKHRGIGHIILEEYVRHLPSDS